MKTKTLTLPKPRNIFAVLASNRKAGSHRKSFKAQRRAENSKADWAVSKQHIDIW